MPPFASSNGSGNLISSTSTVSYRKGGSIQNKVSSKTKFPKRQSTLQKSFVTCQYLVFSLVCVLIGAVYFLTRAPLHLYYDRLQVNDDRSIYVQGVCRNMDQTHVLVDLCSSKRLTIISHLQLHHDPKEVVSLDFGTPSEI
jgi:hypothetical protein